MPLPHLTSDKAMQALVGPDSFAGDPRVYIAEKPFVTIQGEGPNVGKNTLFIRFFGCNLANSCGVDWCDSGHSFYTNKEGNEAPKEDKMLFHDVNSFWEYVFETNSGLTEFNNIVFTGGEPLLWQYTIAELLQKLKNQYKRTVSVEIETNGTIGIETELIDWFRFVHFNISPKVHVAKSFILLNQLQNVGHIGESNYNYSRFEHDDWILKFVWETEKTNKLIEDCIQKYNIPKHKIYLMPEGISREEQTNKMQKLAEYCINNGYNFSPRLHVLIWNIAKGI